MSTVNTAKKSGVNIVLVAQKRVVAGKRGAARVREQQRIPAVVYGRSEPVSISIDEQDFGHQFHHVSENVLIDLQIADDTRHVIIKDYDANPITGRILHLDFLEIEKGKMLRTHIAVVPVGTSIGVRSGGVYEQPAHEIEIECLPKDMPQQLEMDITDVGIGDSINVSDLQLPEGVSALSNSEMTLCHVATVRVLQVESEGADDSDIEDDDGADGAEE